MNAPLLERLAAGRGAAPAVVTPNSRLAQGLARELDAFQAARGVALWEAPDILPFPAFVERLYEEALYSDAGGGLPALLTAAQEEHLWREILRGSKRELLVVEQAAAQCREAWQLVHAWRIPPGAGNEDAAAFSEWAAAYRRRTAREVDAARLPDAVATWLLGLRLPRALVAYGFDILAPQTREFFDALARHGVAFEEAQPARKNAKAVRASFPSARAELEAAAGWARGRLEAGKARIGVVVPDLQSRRKEVARVFARANGRPHPFNVSLGEPLAGFPIVRAALSLLELTVRELPFERAAALLRSPFLGGAESELGARARLDVALRKDAPARLSLASLVALSEPCPHLRTILEEVFSKREDTARSAAEWARQFSRILAAAGFPGERGLDSDEFQARAKWHEALGELARLERFAPKMTLAHALATLERLCRDTLFQPQSADVPVQVLGVLESAGLAFDCLWVSGLSDEAWPLDARPNPFVPVALQKQAGVPQASAEGSLELDRRITQGWLGAADEVVLSHFEREEDRELAPSALILGVPKGEVAIPLYPNHRDLVFAARKISAVDDSRAPALAEKKVPGGTRVLSDQSACPFRAFARWRLRAERLEAPAEGLDAAERGQLLHALMSALWQELKGSAALGGELAPAIARAAAAAVKSQGLQGRFAELERERLARLAAEWLELERTRAPFEVAALEKEVELDIAGLRLRGRMDRVDRLAGGGHALIDYKTSARTTPHDWKPPRPDDAQLPIYAVAMKEDVAAVMFARVRPGAMRFMGFSKQKNAVPGVQPAKSWPDLLRGWKEETEALGAAFAAGEARVDPKRELQTCRYCALQTLCRVYEKVNVLAEDDEAAE
ncbi:MAG TPA: PD-(D/E)XK nuclease family protein [Burkholderiales bacterium]|nr:PD-(D/E)XK nuclease family protein [Burkholderiales bacterium]